MEEKKKKVLFFVAFILLMIVLLVLVLDHVYKDKEKVPTPVETPSEKFDDNIVALNDYNEFFTVNNILNQYYQVVAGSDDEILYSYLDDSYIKDNNITLSNLSNKIKRDFDNVNYTATEIYYNENSIITYYFVNGYLRNNNLSDDTFQYYKDLKYLVIVNKSKRNFMITPITTSRTILDYATNYSLERKEVKKNVYSAYKTTEQRVLQTYLVVFQNLLFLDNEAAYKMLASETQKKYANYEDFKSQVADIYTNIGTKIFSYAKDESGDKIVYKIIDDKERRYTIYEEKVMSFKIAY